MDTYEYQGYSSGGVWLDEGFYTERDLEQIIEHLVKLNKMNKKSMEVVNDN